MKIHAYKIVTDNGEKLGNLLAFIKSHSEVDRIRDTPTSRMRFEDGAQARNGSSWTLDFTKFRDAGPGKAPENAPNLDFDLGPDEYFGEETAAIYVPATDCLVVQYNHHGPRVAAVESYLNIFTYEARQAGKTNIKDITLRACAQRDTANRLHKASIVKRLEFTLHVPGVSQTPSKKRKAFGAFLKMPIVSSSQTINVKVSAGHSHTLNVAEVKSFIAEAMGLDDGVTQLKVRTKENSWDSAELLDLLETRLEIEKPLVPSRKKRHDRNQRWSVLRSAYDEWIAAQAL